MTDLNALRIGFIGAGRVGCGLAKAFGDAGCRVIAVASRSRDSAERLSGFAEGCVPMTAQAVADACDLVFVTTPDGDIETATGSVTWREGQSAIHCSGVTEVSALAAAERDGAWIGGFHPMQSFTDPLAAAASLRGCTVTIEAEPRLNETLEALAEALGCPVNRLPPGKRALYHATAGYGSQFINVLLAEIATAWRGWGASDEDVVRAILPMIRGTLASIESAGIAGGMPGPVSRGDVATIEKHVAAIEDEDALAFYIAHCQRSVTLAKQAGRIDDATVEKLKKSLTT